MSRRKAVAKREILPDPKHGNLVLAKFVNMIMIDGKKSTAENIVYTALDVLESKGHADPVEALINALEKVQPAVEVKSRRVGGATYQVPVEVRPVRRMGLSMRWVIESARKRSEKGMSARLAGELLDALDSRGAAYKKREDTHRMAEANKAFSHFRW